MTILLGAAVSNDANLSVVLPISHDCRRNEPIGAVLVLRRAVGIVETGVAAFLAPVLVGVVIVGVAVVVVVVDDGKEGHIIDLVRAMFMSRRAFCACDCSFCVR